MLGSVRGVQLRLCLLGLEVNLFAGPIFVDAKLGLKAVLAK